MYQMSLFDFVSEEEKQQVEKKSEENKDLLQAIKENFAILGLTITILILAAMTCSSMLSRMTKSNTAVRRTIVIEVGMQNAAQAIAIASSPFIFNSAEMAIPAIIYALLMNVILLIYVAVIKKK